jgi:serine phosphatase RsbU (regulator of sigma subunit)
MLVRARKSVKAQGVGFGGAGAQIGLEQLRDERRDEEGLADVTLLTKGGPIIGAFNDCVYEQETIQMESGDLLVAYTDGVTEARNADDQEFGEASLRRIIDSSAHLPAQRLSEQIVDSVREWCGEVPPHDDLTLVVMRVR